MPINISPLNLPEGSFHGFQLIECGKLQLAAQAVQFGYEIEICPSVVLAETLIALASTAAPVGTTGQGFGIRIDWERGEIWDAINGSGLIGWLDDEWERGSDNVKVRFEIERIGSAMLPKLTIGSEQWLYPALHRAEATEFIAIAGCLSNTMRDMDPKDVFEAPKVWTGKQR